MNTNDINFNNILVVVLLIFIILIFTFIAINLRPLARWADYQTICIEQESTSSTIPWAVRKCNGRSKVYEVK